MINKFIAPCGYDCRNCLLYKYTTSNVEAYKDEIKNKYPLIKDKDMFCVGCMMDGTKNSFCDKNCNIKQCAKTLGHSSCGKCDNLNHCKLMEKIVLNAECYKNLMDASLDLDEE